MSSSELAEAPVSAAPKNALTREDLRIGMPLEWPITDGDGAIILDRGAAIASEQDRDFLFRHFQPRRRDIADAQPAAPVAATELPPPSSLIDMHLTIGALLGVRSQIGIGQPMHPCRVIGFAPNHTLFVTPPLKDGRPTPLSVNENVDIVAIGSQAVYRFTCTVEALCNYPFNYVVLSKPGAIRRLRERRSIRVRTRLAVRFGSEANELYDGIGLANGISALGLSMAASKPLGRVGERLRLSFRLKSGDIETLIETRAVIRNVQADETHSDLTTHGLEFDVLEPAQQTALKAFVFDRQDDAYFWTNMTR
jgi:c-di-GMP-binding flagellar brake protein YcgR